MTDQKYYQIRRYPKGVSYRIEIFPRDGIVSKTRRIIGSLIRGKPYIDDWGATIDGRSYIIREWGIKNFPIKYDGIIKKFKRKCYEHKENTGRPLRKASLTLKLSEPTFECVPLPEGVVKVTSAFNIEGV